MNWPKKWTVKGWVAFGGIAVAFWSILAGGLLVASQRSSPLGSHYLLLVTFLRKDNMTKERLAVFDRSPYDGVAFVYTGAYDVGPVPTADEWKAEILAGKQSTKKDLWPWIYLNRMVGRDPNTKNTAYGRDPYFLKIPGMDLENTTGAQEDFLALWRNSLAAAKATQTPGIVLDMEFYTNLKGYDPTELAMQAGKTPQETLDLLRKLGARLADSAAKGYPNAVLWFLFTHMDQVGTYVKDGVKYNPAPAYLVFGLLDRIREKGYALKVIAGGEASLGYCSTSLGNLQQKIAGRASGYRALLQKYPQNFELGGTIILWKDRASKTSFLTEGVCGQSPVQELEDFQPYLEALFKGYRYNWIYGVYGGGYDPFHPMSAPRFDAVIRRAEASVYGSH